MTFVTCLILAAPPAAAGVSIHGQVVGIPAPGPGTGFALHLAREDLALAYGPGEEDSERLELRRLGVTLNEAVGERTRLGVRLGRLWLSQSGRAATDGIDPAGYYIDLTFATGHALGAGIQATLDASWRYAVAEATDDTDTGTETRLEWLALTIRPALRFPLRERLALRAGAAILALDGDEHTRGPQGDTTGTTTTGFESDGHVGGFLSIELRPAPDDIVALRLEGGPRTGVFVRFEHRY